MIRCCSKLFFPLPSHNGGPVCLSRIYVTSSSRDFNQRRYASGESQPPRRFRKFFYTTVGLTLVGVGGVVVYAKSDPKFRKVLDSYVPGSDKFISIIYQEEGSFNIDITEQLSSIQDKVLSFPSEIYKQLSGTTIEESPPVLPKAKELKSEEASKPKLKPVADTTKKEGGLSNISDQLMKGIVDGINYYESLLTELEGKSKEILHVIDKLAENSNPTEWKESLEKYEEISKYYDKVGEGLSGAKNHTRRLVHQLSTEEKKLPQPIFVNLKITEKALLDAEAKVDDLFYNKIGSAIKFFQTTSEGRKQFYDELSVLFPKTMPGDRRVKLDESEVDLFLYYAFQKINFYQKELNNMETVVQQKVKKAIESKNDAQLLEAAVAAQVDEAKRRLKEDFDKKMVELKQGCEQQVHDQMKRQEQVHLDVLNEQLALKEKEVERKLLQRMEEKLLEEEGRLQAELADMTGRMQGLNEAIAKRALQDQKAQTSQALWSAAEAFYGDLKHSKKEGGGHQPISDSVEAVRNAAAKGDDLVETVLATIPSAAVKQGVYPEDALRDRFLKVEKVAWRVAGVPEEGASLPKLLVAWLQSTLVIKASEPIPPGELNNEPFDPKSLSNYDILQRARYWVDRGDFEQALKYMNLLKGGARAISSDWMKEATILLETQQAANILLAHASASGMVYS